MSTPIIAVSTAGLARKVNLSQPTVMARIKARGIEPDIILVGGNGRTESLLWNCERLPQLREALGNKKEVIV